MNSLRVVWNIARADFLERARRYSYLATLAVTLIAGVYFVPPQTAAYVAFDVDGYRGIYNSAWMGAMMAILATTTLSLFGFYLIKNAIAVDRETRVGEIVAATSVGKLQYVAGKWLGNAAVLLSLGVVLIADAAIMQLVRGEDRSIDLFAIVSPFAMVFVPVVALVAAAAVLFETIPFLRGGIGNVVYFFAWIFGLSVGAQPTQKLPAPWNDPLGLVTVGSQIDAAVRKIAPHRVKGLDMVLGSDRASVHERLFLWHGFTWSGADVAGRFAWCLLAFALVVLGALLFDRFAQSAISGRERAPKPWQAGLARSVERVSTPVFDRVFAGDFGALVLAELRLMLKGVSLWWYVVAGGLWIATLATPSAQQSIVLGLAWLWPILTWSHMGTRETSNDTQGFVYPSLRPLGRQFAALWVAGIALALLAGSGSLAHWLFAGSATGIVAVLAGAVFVPTLALACGAVSGTSRLFEIVYLVLWYVGPMNATPLLDFTAASGMSTALVAAVVLAIAAFAARRARLHAY